MAIYAGEVIIPKRGTETFLSTIGQLDDRIDLYKGKKLVEGLQNINIPASGPGELDDRAIMDLCIMASKLAYENAQVVRNVVVHHWQASYSISISISLTSLNFIYVMLFWQSSHS